MTTATLATTRTTVPDRVLAEEDLIITKTDLQGRLTYCNETFLRFSALTEDEALGRPHNIIRHPEMPGGIFTLLWQRAQAGEELFAYVRNRGLDGIGYWVFAYVTQSCDVRDGFRVAVGYHSMRRAPRAAAIPEVTDVYAKMRAAEVGSSRKAAAAAGLEWLTHYLAERGLTYDQWVWALEGR